MIEVPNGWIKTFLSDVAQIDMGQSPPGEFTNSYSIGVPLIGGAADYSEGKLHATRYTSMPSKICEKGDLVISIRATIGKIAIADQPFCLGRGVAGIKPFINNKWLFYKLSESAKQLDEAGVGSTFRQIDKKTLEQWPILLPPPNEQNRIAEKIDLLLSKSLRARKSLENIPFLVEKYKQAILLSAVNGTLTDSWRVKNQSSLPSKKEILTQIESDKTLFFEKSLRQFESNKDLGIKSLKPRKPIAPNPVTAEQDLQLWKIPNEWQWIQTGTICFVTKLAGFEYTDYVKYDVNGDLKVLKAENAGPNGFKQTEYSRIYTNSVSNLERSILTGGELLVVFVGAGVGQVATVPDDDKFFLGPNIGMARPYTKLISAKFLELFFRSNQGKNLLLASAKAVAQPSLSMSAIRSTPIAIPSIEEQNEIVKKVEFAFSWIDNLADRSRFSQSLIDKLDFAILKKAFEGTLIKNDPNHISISAYLQEIKELVHKDISIQKNKTRKILIPMVRKTLFEVLSETENWLPAQEAFSLCGIHSGATTEDIEPIYSELRTLDLSGLILIDSVRNEDGKKLYDRIKLNR